MVVEIGVIALAVGAFGYGLWREFRSRAVSPFPAARRLGLSCRGDTVRGTLEGRQVILKDVGSSLQVTVMGFDHRLSLTLERMNRVEDVVTGDPDFDDTILTQGDEAAILATMNAEVRKLCVRLIPGVRGVIEDGVLVIEITSHEPDEPAFLLTQLRPYLNLQAACDPQGTSVTERLLRNVADDPHHAVRERNLRVLLEQPVDEFVRQAAEMHMEHPDPAIRLRAARVRGDVGLATVREIAGSPGASRVAALSMLSLAENVSVFAGALEDPDAERYVLEVLTQEPLPELLEVLKLRARTGRSAHGEAFCRALAAYGEAGQPALLHLLHDDSRSTVLAACTALGAVGTARAVRYLEAVTVPAARTAILEIQGRLDGAEGGQLSVVETQDGALSVAGPSGGLSVPDAE